MKDLLLYEKLQILAMDENEGKATSPNFFKYALAAAILFELALQKRLKIKPEGKYKASFEITDPKPTGDSFLDDLFIKIQSRKSTQIRGYLDTFGSKSRSIQSDLMDRLVEKGVLTIESKRFGRKKYSFGSPELKQQLKAELATAVTTREINDNRLIILLALTKSAALIFNFFDTGNRNLAQKVISRLLKSQRTHGSIIVVSNILRTMKR